MRVVFAFLAVLAGVVLFLCPAGVLIEAIFDPALSGPGVPKMARRLHRSLTPRYAKWAAARIAEGKAAKLSLGNVSGTEWPLYGSVFYLKAEEALQDAWDRDHSLLSEEPRVFARDAIDAATRLVIDPNHAAWVKKYWGEAYLDKEDLFYRMLVISALVSHRRLTGSDEFLPLLRRQADGLSTELTASPFGLLDDYPGQCYPTDIVSAWDAIHRADAVLGTNHSPQIAHALRAFTGNHAGALGLPPYFADSRSGQPADNSRGCSNSNACMLAPTLWPEIAGTWYNRHVEYFWQENWLATGFREFPRGTGKDWYFDVDAGPVVLGNGFAASAFGVAAARRNGRFDQAYPLSLEMIALSWPLPDGRLVLPRLVSDSQDAPLLGEAAILCQLTSQPVAQTRRYHSGLVPGLVFLGLAVQLAIGTFCVRRSVRFLRVPSR